MYRYIYYLKLLFYINGVCFREIFTLNDGGEVALDWMEDKCAADSPVILILPGLTGKISLSDK